MGLTVSIKQLTNIAVYTSPGDPLFYLHHAQIDRVWWLWQLLDPSTRMQGESAVAGSK